MTTTCSSAVVNGRSFSEDGDEMLVSELFRGPAWGRGACITRLGVLQIRWFFSVSLLAQGLGWFVFARIGGYRV